MWASVIDVKRVSRAPSSSSSLHKQRAQQDRKGERTRRGGTRKQLAEEVNAKLFFSIDFFCLKKLRDVSVNRLSVLAARSDRKELLESFFCLFGFAIPPSSYRRIQLEYLVVSGPCDA